MNRREFGKLTAAAAIASLIGFEKTVGQTTNTDMEKEHEEYMKKYADLLGGKKLTIALMAYPGMFLQDLVGPLTVFEALLNRDIHIVWKDTNSVNASSLVQVTPTKIFAECPKELDVLVIPGGGQGTLDLMKDKEILDFIREKEKTARFIGSVCTGSLILGAAGLLKGYKATSHWATRDVLKEFGAIPTEARIVEDRKIITGGGVTAGIDFALAIAAKLRSPTYAEAIQLYLEYDPQPPFNAGSPKNAPKEVVKFVGGMLDPMANQARQIAKEGGKDK